MPLVVNVISREQIGDVALVVADVTFDNSYPTGGEQFNANNLGVVSIPPGFDPISSMIVQQKGLQTRLCSWDQTNGKLMLAAAGGGEVANGSDQSTVTVRVTAICNTPKSFAAELS